jgi:signal peptidase
VSAVSLTLPRPRRGLRGADRAASAALAAIALLLALLGAGHLAGGRSLIERSGSMAPAIAPGDLLLSRPVAATAVRVGDVVSFLDPLYPGIPITHRVVALRRVGARVAVTTRGDANPVAEQWSAPASGSILRVAARVPAAGYALGALSGRWTRLVLLTGACAGLAGLALRRIWRT